jgi:sulfite reductase (ferredoxin)
LFYQLPSTLSAEITELETLIGRFQAGDLDAASLKARRVPFGCYEQRKDGTYMVRIRATGGAITPSQLRAIAQTSTQYGAPFVHITTRQEFQIHDVDLKNVIPVMRALLPAGLSSRGGGGNTVRNIVVSPGAGISDDEIFDPSPYAFALTSRLIAEPDSWNLPRKLKIAFSNSPADSAFAQFTDLGFIASIRKGQKGFKVYVAGGFGAKPAVGRLLHEFLPAENAYIAAEAVKRLFDQYGNRKNRNAARIRFLWEQLGDERFRALYQAEFDAIAALPDSRLEPVLLAEPLSVPDLKPLNIQDVDFEQWKRRYVRPQRQKGLFSVTVPASLGNIANIDLEELANFLEEFGDHSVRAAFGQNLRLRNIHGAFLGNVYVAIRSISNLSDAPLLLSNSVACTGADTCKLGICLPKGALSALEKKLRGSVIDLDALEDFRINLSGCPNSCGQHVIADLGFYGQAKRNGQRMYPSYAVVAGAVHADGLARLAQPIDSISARDLPAFTEQLLAAWLQKRNRFASFAEYIDSEGKQDIQALADRFQDVPSFEDDKNYYFDWSAEEIFSIVGRGVGECSAGLFDLIGVDQKIIADQKKRLEDAPQLADYEDAVYRIALSAARMLLVTRGVEAPNDEAVFQNFLRHFIEAGLIDERFRAVVELARASDRIALTAQRASVLALADAVEALYASMDNSLRFPVEQSKPANGNASPTQVERDYRGVACPMNFVKVKLDLSRMKKGEHLRVLLDDGQPIENVPRSVAGEGHKIVAQAREGKHWSVEIEKA